MQARHHVAVDCIPGVLLLLHISAGSFPTKELYQGSGGVLEKIQPIRDWFATQTSFCFFQVRAYRNRKTVSICEVVYCPRSGSFPGLQGPSSKASCTYDK